MFENIVNFFKKLKKNDKGIDSKSKETAKERLHLVLMQDRANVSADFLDMMKQEIIEVIKKYIDIDEKAIDVKLTNKMNDDGTVGAPALYANIPIVTIKNEARKVDKEDEEKNVDVELEENKTEEKIRELEMELEKLHNQQPLEPVEVEKLLEYWDKEDTIVAEIKELSSALSRGIDIIVANNRTPADNIQYIIDTFGVEEEGKI